MAKPLHSAPRWLDSDTYSYTLTIKALCGARAHRRRVLKDQADKVTCPRCLDFLAEMVASRLGGPAPWLLKGARATMVINDEVVGVESFSLADLPPNSDGQPK